MPDSDFTPGNPDLAREVGYAELLKQGNASRTCILCYEDLKRRQQCIHRETHDWILLKAIQPYRDQLGRPPVHHVLIVPKRHLTDELKMTDDDGRQVMLLFRWAREHLKMEYGLLFIQFGNAAVCRKAGRTLPHIHFHINQPYDGDTAALVVPSGRFLHPHEIEEAKAKA